MSESSLPKVVSDYIQASNAHDLEAYLNTFSDSSVIVEESIGRDLVGKKEIGHYFVTYFIQMNTHTDIMDYSMTNNVIDMRVLFQGDFPGKEITGLYQFCLSNGHIEKLRADLEG